MTKKSIIFCTAILSFFCLITPASAISESQGKAIQDHCDSIKEVLKNIQKDDSRTRVYLGAYYETVLSKYIIPLNVRLVENNLSSAKLIENQNSLADARTKFIDDFIIYQQALEEIILQDCHKESQVFYDKLEIVRQKRQTVATDTTKIRELLSSHVKLITKLKQEL